MTSAGKVALFSTLAAFVACSSDQPPRSGANTTGATGTGTGVISGGTTTGGIVGGRDGGAGGADSGIVKDPIPDPCMTTSDCADGGGGYVCTISNKCGKILGPCTTQAECMGDSYCCLGPMCRKDGLPDGVCIPGYVPPGNTDCKGTVKIGVFSPAVQCEWPDKVMLKGIPTKVLPPAPFDRHVQVMSTPMVADTPVDSGASAEMIFVAGNQNTGEALGNNPAYFGVIQIVSGQTCELKATLGDVPLRQTAPPALGDLDGDGMIDIVARRNDHGLVAYRWDSTTNHYVKYWETPTEPTGLALIGQDQFWDGPSIHDLDNDGFPEVILRQAVFNGRTGALMNPGPAGVTPVFNGLIPVLGDVDGDGKIEIVVPVASTSIGLPDWTGTGWGPLLPPGTMMANEFGTFASHFAYADFGSFQNGTFEHSVAALDGKAEIVAVNTAVDGTPNSVSVYSQDAMGIWQQIMQVVPQWDPNVPAAVKQEQGGPPTIGDFDGDGLPEFAIAGGTRFRVFDLECKAAGPGCEAPYIKWSQPSQDASSKQTGSSAFDFDGDGAVEVVYADECFLRVYDGKTGDVKYSAYRTSATWYEGPTIADVNKDQTTKILVNSSEYDIRCPAGSTGGTPSVDPIHAGVRCLANEDCTSMNCVAGYCRCTNSTQCGDPGLVCTTPIGGAAGGGNTCRAQHPNGSGTNPLQHGIRVLNDRLNRWASSRPMWNQHAYSVTNINDDGTIPKTSDWLAKQNFKVKGLNNYRQNVQGTAGVEDLPDITGKLDTGACQLNGNSAVLTVNVCNRGKRAVPAAVPVTFYDSAGGILCTGQTNGPVPTGSGCKPVDCAISGGDVTRVVGKTVTVKVNDDGHGQRATVECNYGNNSDSLIVMACKPPQ